MLSGAVARSSFDVSGIRYVLPVLWMTSRFPIMGTMTRGIGSIYVSAALQQVVINFQRIHHTVRLS